MQYLRKHHSPAGISVEVEKPNREGLEELALLADMVFYSKSWALVSFLILLNCEFGFPCSGSYRSTI
jgi:hypothetical protein